MSLINDALKRAQEERLAAPGEMPGVPVYQKAPDRSLRREIGVIALLVILVVLLFGGLVGLLVYLRLRPSPAPPAATPLVAVTAPATTTTPAAAAGPESPAAAPRAPQSRYGKAMRQANVVAGQVASLEREGQEMATAPGTPPAPPVTPPAPAPVPAAPPALAAAGTPATPPAAPPAVPPPSPPAVPAYKLSGIIGRAPTFTALINGQMVKVRDHVGTAELITLETTRAVLREADGKTIELTISGNR